MKCPIVVFSHLRWDFVYQRPQQLLSRFAQRHRVLYIEEPVANGSGVVDGWELSRPAPDILVARPSIADLAARPADEIMRVTGSLVQELVAREGFQHSVAWMYTPMMEPLLDAVDPLLIVYDVMDELSLFLGAPPELLRRETALLERADLVFTGGVSLYEAKRQRHPRVSCFPSSVDARHFARARPGAIALPQPPDQERLPHPRLGYFGVIDERLDLAVLHQLGASHPEWQLVIVGPTVKIDPATLPVGPNIHYTGQRSYSELPAYLSGWDVCLLPFALNDATRFISPTKTLEYMAAERPIVSTPIADVVSSYGEIVYLADSPGAFVGSCEAALGARTTERESRAAAMREVVARSSWDSTAASMERIIDEALAGRFAQHI